MDQYARSVPVVVFVLWDDDIYDAWARKAEELKLNSYDPDAKYPKKTVEPSNSESDEEQPTKKFNPTVIDVSTPDEQIKKPDEDTDQLISRLPSVPHAAPDTQGTEEMEHENSSTPDKPSLTTGARYVFIIGIPLKIICSKVE